MEDNTRTLSPSKFLAYFKDNAESIRTNSNLIGDVLIVERIKFPEKKVGSIFISNSKTIQSSGLTSETPEFYRVLLVGAGYYDDDTGEDKPLEVAQGDIVHAASVSVRVWSSFPMLEIADSDVLGKMRFTDVQWQWKGEEAFIGFLSSFNEAVKRKV